MVYSPLFPVTKSFLSQAALADTVAATYGLSNVRCQLIAAFMRDVYQVSNHQQCDMFFVYRHNQRTLDEIKATLKLLKLGPAESEPDVLVPLPFSPGI